MSSITDYFIRKVNLLDSRRVWEIRNNPTTKAQSLNNEFIDFDKHSPWFTDKYFKTIVNVCYVLEYKKQVIGYLRFDLEGNYYLLSIALDPEYIGKGLGHYLLSNGLSRFDQNKEIRAIVRLNNLPSLNLFRKNNFQIFSQDDNNYYLKYQIL